MKSIYSGLIAILVLLVVAPLAIAGSFPSWDRKIDSAKRFKVLDRFEGEAVLDRETGLVWERSPGET